MKKTKVLLIKPPSSSLGAINQSLSLAYLAAVLEKHSFPVKIIDAPVLNLRWRGIKKIALQFQPGLIGLTATTEEFPQAAELAAKFRPLFPQTTLILGGPHASVATREALRQSHFDLAVIGEGEMTLLQIARQKEAGRLEPEKVPGLAFKKSRRIIFTPPRPFVKDLDKLPFPARHLLPPLAAYHPTPGSYKNLPVGTLMTAHGCPFQCTFCARNVFGNQVRLRKPAKIVEEIEILIKKFGAREIRLWDDTFNLQPDRVIAICRLIVKKKLCFTWSCQARVNFVNSQMLHWMKRAGCWQISYGLESGNQQILNRIKKGITLDMVRRAVSLTKKAGIEIKGFFMVGHPGDTPATIRQTIDFAKSLPLDLATFSITTPFPGTEIYEEALKTGRLKKTDYRHYRPYQTRRLAYTAPGFTAAELITWQRRAYREFYLRPRIFWQELKKIRNFSQLQTKISGFLNFQPDKGK